ncbi:anti-sigma factor domain-containing protein [Neobacillus sp. YIM B06451]|uniref:anti-sigma factor domain-containing protein n=1 Tax=Neobacillus sp. YIM B06451 TaxID=3070994 RepID=UPI00292D969C|nr:anti-sigma factor domain-containing protein [Neobacillus sp. YIM B06451]
MRTGIILEMDESFLTLLTPEGEFLRARRKGKVYSIGQEITFEPATQSHREKRNAIAKLAGMKKVWMSAAAALIIMASVIFPLNSSNQVYAYMSIDVNPSIELGVNEKMQVLRMDGYNDEGKKIVSRLKDWKKEDVSEVAEKILSEIGRQGYFAKTNKVIISTVKTGEKEEKADLRLKETVKEISDAAKRDKHDVTIVSASARELKEARKQGKTTGNYKAGVSAEQQADVNPAVKDNPAASHSAVKANEGKSSAPGQTKKADPLKPVVPLNPENKGNGTKNPNAENGKGKQEGKPKENNSNQKGKTHSNGNKENGKGKEKGNEQNNGNGKGDNQGKKGSDVKGGDPNQKKDNKKDKNSLKGNGSQKSNAHSKQGNNNGQNHTHDSKNKNGEKGNKQENNGQKDNSKLEKKESKDSTSKNNWQEAEPKNSEKGKSGK